MSFEVLIPALKAPQERASSHHMQALEMKHPLRPLPSDLGLSSVVKERVKFDFMAFLAVAASFTPVVTVAV
jgi:hypothetical protein